MYGLDKGFLLETEGLAVIDVEVFDIDEFGPIGVLHIELAIFEVLLAKQLDHVEVGGFVDDDAGLLEVIEGEVGLFAEDADFAFGFEGQARRGEIGDTAVVAQQADTVLRRQYVNLLMRGMPREQVAQHMEQLQAGSEEQAKQQLKTFFIMDKVADKLEIDVSEEEINGYIAELAQQRNQRPERLKEQMEHDGSLAQFNMEVRQNKCIEKLLETAKITEKKPDKKAKKTKKAAKKSKKKPVKKAAKKTKSEEKDS